MPAKVWPRRALLRYAGGVAAAGFGGALLAPYLRDVGYRKPVLEPPPLGPHYRGERPNILVVVVDDLAAGVVGKRSRFPFLKTPHISSLEGEGVFFPQAFVPTAVCSPSRASLLTGTYAHTHGVRVNDTQDLGETPPSFPSLLKRAGYETGFVGKWHMDSAHAGPRLGFDTWLSFAGQGVYKNPVLNENGRDFPVSGYVTDVLSRYAAAWVQRPRDRPFCLIVSHKAAHVPFEAAARHRFAFAGAELPEPANFGDTLEGKPAWQRRYKLCGLHPDTWDLCSDADVPALLPAERWNPRNYDLLTHLRTLLAVDESVGLLMEALRSVGQLDDTLIVFTSDNGFLLGAHRLFDKRTMHEESIRVPLVLRYPKRVPTGSEPPELVSTLDLAPTILELAGVRVPETVQGLSLWPLLDGSRASWRTELLYEYFQEYGPGVPSILGVRSERWKYVTYPELTGDIGELYDLRDDPLELRNLISVARYQGVVAAMQGALEQQLAATGYSPSQAVEQLEPVPANF
ncbi:MAG: Arylsulfatase [uncultured Truepera sp.]|uniref:Arylsulfatase n=1 Tax=uncultured Truepera sp. TaxID=543023 RepID=A0A6J4VR06_9DEIN|nr:MAG: Arylsulfatase [uncultured Truepera sp.]